MQIDHSRTSNGKLMADDTVLIKVEQGIASASDAIIPAGTSLYRAGHSTIRGLAQSAGSAFLSPWWCTYYDFNMVTWARVGSVARMPGAARNAFAIHPAWGGDCRNFASIITTTDLSVWFGLGKSMPGFDANGQMSIWFGSEEVLQIYIPGFEANALGWSEQRQVFRVGESFSNGIGCQAIVPQSLRTNGNSPVVQFHQQYTFHDLTGS